MHARLATLVVQVEVAAQAFAAYMRIPCPKNFHAALRVRVVRGLEERRFCQWHPRFGVGSNAHPSSAFPT
jgi:hypothetical protein